MLYNACDYGHKQNHKDNQGGFIMSVNGVSTVANQVYATDSYGSAKKSSTKDKVSEESKVDKGVVYDKTSVNKMSESERAQLVQKLKADTDSRVANLKSLVESMFLKQGQKITDSDSMWKMLADGKLNVDPETAAKAREEISEDGYWGVKQTSERIFDMAVALSGGDSDKMDKMLSAFKKGFEAATKAWGKTLPDISHQTYDAVLEKFENYKNQE